MVQQLVERVLIGDFLAINQRPVMTTDVLCIAHFATPSAQNETVTDFKRNTRRTFDTKTVNLNIGQVIFDAFNGIHAVIGLASISAKPQSGNILLLSNVRLILIVRNTPISRRPLIRRPVHLGILAGQLI